MDGDSSFNAVSEEYEDAISETANDYENLEDENILITEMTEEEAEDISNEAGVLIVEEDTIVYAQTNENEEKEKEVKENKVKDKTVAEIVETSVENADSEWNMEMINSDAPEVDQIQSLQTKIKVALIDSGLDVTENIDVAGRINLIPGEEEVLPLYEDTTGHGTFIAGIIAANNDYEYSDVKGINDQVELYSAKVLDSTNSAPISRVIEGIYWAIEQNVDIINLSFSTNVNSAALHTAIKDAYNVGILIVAASGNSSGAIEYPAAYPEVMAVGSVDSSGVISDFCSTGEEMEIVAPGELIKSTGGFGGELIESGTSMAVPHVVGVASILWQKDPTKSADFIRQLINESANYLGDENIYGNGLVDLEYALEIYDEFAETYVPNTNISNELSESDNYFENDEEITGFDDVSYVEGRWGSTDHQSVIDYSNSPSGATPYLTSSQITTIKQGVIWQDIDSNGCRGMGTYPYMHGYFAYLNSSNQVIGYNNYVASYQYIMKSIAAGYPIYTTSTTGGGKYIYSILKNKFGTSFSSDEKLFALGIAIHIESDVFAHSTYNSSGQLISHGGTVPYADTTSYVYTRYWAAIISSEYSIKRFLGQRPGNPAMDIYNAYTYCANGTFTLNNFSNYYYEAYYLY